jgi:hypothetical protein
VAQSGSGAASLVFTGFVALKRVSGPFRPVIWLPIFAKDIMNLYLKVNTRTGVTNIFATMYGQEVLALI